MSDKPVWLLDVDGVLNAVTRKRPPATSTGWPADGWRYVEGDAGTASFPIVAAEGVLEFVRRVHKDGLAEVRWLTTWEVGDYILPLAEKLDLPRFEIAGREMDVPLGEWWKLVIAQRVYGQAGPLVWTDDDISFIHAAKVWAHTRPAGTLLAISPNGGQGLHPTHLAKIEAFLEAQRG